VNASLEKELEHVPRRRIEHVHADDLAPVGLDRQCAGLVILFPMKIAALPIVAETERLIDWTVDPGFWRSHTLFGIFGVALWVRPLGLTRQLPTMINHHVPDTQNRPQNRPGSTTSSTPRSPQPIRPRDADD
jgi:hypothetical protein